MIVNDSNVANRRRAHAHSRTSHALLHTRTLPFRSTRTPLFFAHCLLTALPLLRLPFSRNAAALRCRCVSTSFAIRALAFTRRCHGGILHTHPSPCSSLSSSCCCLRLPSSHARDYLHSTYLQWEDTHTRTLHTFHRGCAHAHFCRAGCTHGTLHSDAPSESTANFYRPPPKQRGRYPCRYLPKMISMAYAGSQCGSRLALFSAAGMAFTAVYDCSVLAVLMLHMSDWFIIMGLAGVARRYCLTPARQLAYRAPRTTTPCAYRGPTEEKNWRGWKAA